MAKLRAYISYAPANLTFVERIAADLTARSIEVGVDRGLMPTRGGSEAGWPAVQTVIGGSDVVLLVTSPQAVASADVMREIQHAIGQRKLIIPLKLRQVNLPAPVDTIQWFDFEEGRYDRDLKYLLLNLAFVVPGGAPTYDAASQMAKLPEPPDGLEALFIAGTSAKARNTPEDRERAAAIYASILERDPNYQNGLVQMQLDELNHQLEAERLQNLERYAGEARKSGDWAREIAALNASGRLQGEQAVAQKLATARQNQQHDNLYRQAAALADADPAGAAEMLRMLYIGAPKFGDPTGLAARLNPPTKRTDAPTRVEAPPPPRPVPQPEESRPAPQPAVPETDDAPSPMRQYLIYGGAGALLGLLIGAIMSISAVSDPNCFTDCEDPMATYTTVGLIVGLAIAYYTLRKK